MIPADIAALRVLLARDDVVERAAMLSWSHVPSSTRPEIDAAIKAAFAAVLELVGVLPAAPAAPGWESVAALQQAYDEMTALYEAADAEVKRLTGALPAAPAVDTLAEYQRGWRAGTQWRNQVHAEEAQRDQLKAVIRSWGEARSDQKCARCLAPIAKDEVCAVVGPLPGVICTHCARLINDGMTWIQGGTPTQQPCHFCTQCGRPLSAQDTAAGRRVCGECETEGPGIVPAAGGEGL